MFMNIFILLGNSSTYRHNVIDIWAKHGNSYIEHAGHFGDEVGDDPVGDFALVFAERSDGFTITGWYLPLWKIVSWDYCSHAIYGKIKNVPSHQADNQIWDEDIQKVCSTMANLRVKRGSASSSAFPTSRLPTRSASLSTCGAPCEDPPHNSTCAAVWHWAPSLHWFLGGPSVHRRNQVLSNPAVANLASPVGLRV